MKAYVFVLSMLACSISSAQVYVESYGAELPMSEANRTAVGTWVRAQWPEAVLTEVERVNCVRKLAPECIDHDADPETPEQCTDEVRAMCSAVSAHAMTAAEHLAMFQQGALVGHTDPANIAVDGSTVTTNRRHGPTLLTAAETIAMAVTMAPMFGISAGALYSMQFHKFVQYTDGAPGPAQYFARAHQRIEVTGQEWLVCLRAATCGRIVD